MTIRVGIIGASFARAAYLPALRQIPDAKVVAIASARLQSATSTAEEFGVSAAYDDWQEMLRNHELDLVCIATPTDTHGPMTLAALKAGAHVLCEKPMAMDAAEAAQMQELAASQGRIGIIGHELRFNPTRRRIHELIQSGALGEIRHVHIANVSSGWSDPAGRPLNDWWSLEKRGGGRLGANGSHQIDLLRWWFGEVEQVSGQIRTVVSDRIDKNTGEAWKATADDFVHMTLVLERAQFADAVLSGVASHNMGNTTQIFGSEGTVILSNDDEKLWFAAANEEFQDLSVEDPNASLPGINPGIWNVSYVGLMQELCAAIQADRPLTDGATFEDGYRTQLVMDAVRQSNVERRWIDMAEESKTASATTGRL